MTTMRQGDAAAVGVDAMPGDVVPVGWSPTLEIGKSGLKRVSGYVDEEFLPQLRGRKAVQIYREMLDNDPIVGALMFSIDRLLRQLEWHVEPASLSQEDQDNAEFVEQCMEDMSHTWDDFISEVLTMVPYGWAWCEVTMKRRVGPWESNGARRSKFTDNKIGWRKISLRAQETLTRWVFDETGGIKAMVQMAPPLYTVTVIPIEKSLLFRTSVAKNNPEGRSLLRTAYRPWYMKKRLEEHEAIGVERDLAGLPVGRVPADTLDAIAGSKQDKMLKAFRQMVRSVRRDEQEGIVLPSMFDENGNQMYDFQLLTSGGSRQFDTDSIIQRYEQRILMSVLADFILVGHEETGSYSMHTDKRGLFQTAINSLAQSIADVLNRYALPRLFAANGIKPDKLPTIKPNDVDPPDLTQLAGFMTAMTQAGLQWFPDPTLEKFIRDAARLPQLDDEAEEVKEAQYRQKTVMELAQQRLQAIQMQQQATQGEVQTQQAQLGLQQQQLQFATNPTGEQPQQPDANGDAQAENTRAQGAIQQAQGEISTKQAATNAKHDGDRQKVQTTMLRDRRDHERKMQALKQQQERARLVALQRAARQAGQKPTAKPQPKPGSSTSTNSKGARRGGPR